MGWTKTRSKPWCVLKNVALSDSEAKSMLFKCCILEYGMIPNSRRAEVLISEAAMQGSKAEQSLMSLISAWKGQNTIVFKGLNQN